jgi:hypothetical protein
VMKKELSFEESIQYPDEFPRPDWETIHKAIEDQPEAERADLWNAAVMLWLAKLIEVLGPAYRIQESDNFLIVTSADDNFADMLADFLESSRTNILTTMEGIAADDYAHKHVVIIFDSEEQYYPYISYFYPDEGEFAMSGGIYVIEGYRHFVFPRVADDIIYSVAAHELAHACLSHLDLPMWLHEGLARTMEDKITGSGPPQMYREQYERHRLFWNEDTIQQFWSGDSFMRPDEGSDLSYELARFAVETLSNDYDIFREFVLDTKSSDSGEAAAIKRYGRSLGELIEQFFGEGNWTLKPERWKE